MHTHNDRWPWRASGVAPKSKQREDEEVRENQPQLDWLEKAQKLRQEAMELESQLQRNPEGRKAPSFAPLPPVYSEVADSIWTMSYRFSDRPDDDSQKTNPRNPTSNSMDRNSEPRRRFFSGKCQLLFKRDGFTDLLQHEPANPAEGILIPKVWGWDVETSSEDGKDYLLFSMDVLLPTRSSSPNDDVSDRSTETQKQRFYWQARQDKEKRPGGDYAISLQDGSVTIKQDLVESTSSPRFWGFVSPRGILARFRLVGDFTARPSRKETIQDPLS